MIDEPTTDMNLSEFPQTARQIPSSALTSVAEEEGSPDSGFQSLAQRRTPLRRSASDSPLTAPLPDRKAAATSSDRAKEPSALREPLPKPRTYSEPVPSPTRKNGTKNERKSDPKPRTDLSLPIRLQLIFGSGGSVKKLVLIPHRLEEMPSSLEATTVAGDCLQLSEASSDAYESFAISQLRNPLSEGVVIQARSDSQSWRWELTRREIYVLQQGMHSA